MIEDTACPQLRIRSQVRPAPSGRRGGCAMSFISAPGLLEPWQGQRHGGTLQITPWERRALQLLAHGYTTTDIAMSLGIAAVEIDPLLTRLFVAMGATTCAEAIAVADRRGLLA